jgi:endonuclease/exonuclease/phosphatase family metal-dependent hydrolase
MKRFSKSSFRNRICVTLFTLTLITAAHAQSPVDSTRLIRVLSYNILHGATLNNDFDLDRIAKVIRSVSPDIVALQEVDFKTNRAGGMDLVTELGLRTGMASLFGRAMDYDGGEYGEGILSRFSFLKTQCHQLPFTEGKEPRSALEVRILLQSGDLISFIGTHLDHTRDQTDRIAQAQTINFYFSDNSVPTILAGDLNAVPGSDPIQILSEIWTDACADNPQPTFPSSHPERRIDYVMFLPGNRWRVIETRVIDEKIASDHCPLLVILELLPKNVDEK